MLRRRRRPVRSHSTDDSVSRTKKAITARSQPRAIATTRDLAEQKRRGHRRLDSSVSLFRCAGSQRRCFDALMPCIAVPCFAVPIQWFLAGVFLSVRLSFPNNPFARPVARKVQQRLALAALALHHVNQDQNVLCWCTRCRHESIWPQMTLF